VVTPGELVRQSLKRCLIPENVTVTVAVPAEHPGLNIDPLQMEQVLTNIITNAVQAMPDGGALQIVARQILENEELVAIAVTDSGAGISPENMKKIFQPLFTTKPRGSGWDWWSAKTWC
jgi:signal transduction histidine kinase